MTHFAKINARIREICLQCGRDPEEITLIGASKYQSLEKILRLARDGLQDLGENYVQELLEKHETLEEMDPDLASKISWHFIGTLQRRKIRQIIGKVSWIHSLDRFELAQELEQRATQINTNCHVLVQVNTGSEESKGGMAPDAVEDFIKECCSFSRLQIGGLMTLPPYHENFEEVRPYFRQVRELRDAINKRSVYKEPLRELSMGMSHDFEVAIEEGATMLRIGTALFGERP